MERYDAVVVGGGFYGLRAALHLRLALGCTSVAVLEAGDEPMSRASYANQARVHNGYHYPRSLLTGYRSQVNFGGFTDEFRDAVVDDFPHYYGIARRLSKTNARQFELFCRRIGSYVADAPRHVATLFDPMRIERVFAVREPSFDSRVLRDVLLARIDGAGGIDVVTGAEVRRIGGRRGALEVETASGAYRAPRVVSAVYSRLNTLHRASGLPEVDLQHELAEMALVSLPDELGGAAFTIMDGPFFSLMPFPSKGLHTLSHVRFTVHHRWRDPGEGLPVDPYAAAAAGFSRSRFPAMAADAARYLPVTGRMVHRESLFEVKTVMARTGTDDSRPILFREDHGIPGYTCILGGKLDNIYDVLDELRSTHAA